MIHLFDRIKLLMLTLIAIYAYIILIVFHVVVYHQDFINYLDNKYKFFINIEKTYIPVNTLTFLLLFAMVLIALGLISVIFFIEEELNINTRNTRYIRHLIETNNKLIELINENEIPYHVSNVYINQKLNGKNEKKEKCSICLTNMKIDEDIYLTICGHMFHGECFDLSQEFCDKCPLCRRQLYSEIEY
jgi:hypothetical protein